MISKNKITLWAVVIILFLTGLADFLNHIGYGIAYQGSDSMPKGWYFYTPARFPLHRDQIVVFKPTPLWQEYLEGHHWLLSGALLMKPVAAVPGDLICIRDHQLYINQQKITAIVADYAPGKALPELSFCRRLLPGEYWMLSTHIKRSFDSRYFGPVDELQVIGLVH